MAHNNDGASAGHNVPPANAALANLQHVQSRYVGTGHSDISQHEWATQQHRDSIASYLGHDSLIDYFATAEGISSGRARLNLLERMHRPCGPAPEKHSLQRVATLQQQENKHVQGTEAGKM